MGKMSQEQDTHATILLWGPYKSGKTVFASQFPNPHFITLDPQALMSVRGLKQYYNLDFDVTTININEGKTTDPDFQNLVQMEKLANAPAWVKMKKLTKEWISSLDEDSTLVIDNLSRMGEILQRYVLPQNQTKLGFNEWNQFLYELDDLKEIIFQEHRRCLIIIIAHEEVRHEDITEEKKRYIYIQTRQRHRLPAIATDHIYLYNEIKGPKNKRQVIRKLQTLPDNDTDTGSRALIPDIDYPTFTKVKPYLETALGRKLPEANWTPLKDE